MTKEQEEAIETMRHWIDFEKHNRDKINKADDLIKIQETVLNILKQNSAELAEKSAEIEKLNRQIDLMAEIFYKRFKAELLLEYGFENEEQLKQYFADLVEKE